MATQQSSIITWESWKQEYGKSYSKAEDVEKKRVWEATLAEVTAHNLKYDQGLVSYRLGMNQFAVEDPPLETRPPQGKQSAFHLGRTTHKVLPDEFQVPRKPDLIHGGAVCGDWRPPPPGIDYRTEGLVTSVKNQNPHKTCYAFAAAGALEAQHVKVNKKLVDLSVQQLIDCSDNIPGGGNIENCFEYAKRGLATQHNYPYKGEKESCQTDKHVEVKVEDHWPIYDETQLETIIKDFGPVAVGINIPKDFQKLKNARVADVYNNSCPNTENWHCVLVVGYGTTESRVKYWIIKNSWGVDWGDQGYMKMKRGVNLREIGNYGCYARVQRNN